MLFEFAVTTRKNCELIDITHKVESILKDVDIKEGILTLYIPHTTAGILINEHADPSVAADIINMLDFIIPKNHPLYKHTEGNSAAHIKSSLVGQSKVLLIKDRKLYLGTWQGIFLAEFDGPRQRQVIISILQK